MIKTACPECNGRGRSEQQNPDSTFRAASSAKHATYQTIECKRCNGAGRVERTARVPVMQDGFQIGTLPPDFDPMDIRSASFWYVPRFGDFILDEAKNVFIASPNLGPGDLLSVPGFSMTSSTSN